MRVAVLGDKGPRPAGGNLRHGSTAACWCVPLVKVNRHGTFTVVTDRLNQPTSLEFIRNTAYVVTLGGEIWKIKGVSSASHGVAR